MSERFRQLMLVVQMSASDRELLRAVLQSMERVPIIGAHPARLAIGMFDLAKSRLDSGANVLGLIYDGDHTPKPLRDIMQPFIAGTATRAETEQRLDACTATLQRWLPKMFPEAFSSPS